MEYAIGLGCIAGVGLLNKYFNGGSNQHQTNQSGKIIVITGANTGLGYISAEELARLGAQKVILACRDEKRGMEAVDRIRQATNTDCAEFMKLDLNDLTSVKAFCNEFKAKYNRLDTLMLNAGIMALPQREESKQGHEKQFGTNHVGHFFLYQQLLHSHIAKSDEGRIIVVSSLAHAQGTNRMRLDDMAYKTSYVPWDAYAMSKLANVYFTKHVASSILPSDPALRNVKIVSLHPGVVRTELGRYMMTGWKKLAMPLFYPVFWLFTKPVWYGAQTQLHCALCPFEELQSGSYYSDCNVKQETLCDDWKEDAAKLYELSEGYTKPFA